MAEFSNQTDIPDNLANDLAELAESQYATNIGLEHQGDGYLTPALTRVRFELDAREDGNAKDSITLTASSFSPDLAGIRLERTTHDMSPDAGGRPTTHTTEYSGERVKVLLHRILAHKENSG